MCSSAVVKPLNEVGRGLTELTTQAQGIVNRAGETYQSMSGRDMWESQPMTKAREVVHRAGADIARPIETVAKPVMDTVQHGVDLTGQHLEHAGDLAGGHINHARDLANEHLSTIESTIKGMMGGIFGDQSDRDGSKGSASADDGGDSDASESAGSSTSGDEERAALLEDSESGVEGQLVGLLRKARKRGRRPTFLSGEQTNPNIRRNTLLV